MKAIIFDLDGTLVYTTKECRLYLLRKTFQYFRKDFSDEELDALWFGHGRSEKLEKWGIDKHKFWDIFNNKKMVKYRLKNTSAFDDVDCLKELKDKGIKLAIHTGAPPYTAQKEIALLPGVFDVVRIADPTSNTKSKPAPDGVYEILEELGLEKKDAIYVGNSDEDILTTKNAGIFSVLVDRKEHKHDLVPDRTIESLHELEKL